MTSFRRIATEVAAEVYDAFEVQAERRGITAGSLAGVVLAEWVACQPAGQMCTTIGDENEPAVGVAQVDGQGEWHPYCAECFESLEADGDPVRRFPEQSP